MTKLLVADASARIFCSWSFRSFRRARSFFLRDLSFARTRRRAPLDVSTATKGPLSHFSSVSVNQQPPPRASRRALSLRDSHEQIFAFPITQRETTKYFASLTKPLLISRASRMIGISPQPLLLLVAAASRAAEASKASLESRILRVNIKDDGKAASKPARWAAIATVQPLALPGWRSDATSASLRAARLQHNCPVAA